MPISKASSSAVAPGAKGQLVVGNATNDSGILAVGANGTVLTADSAEATGVKWATPAGGGGMTLLSTTTLSGSSTTISSISGSYNSLFAIIKNVNTTSSGSYQLRIDPNNDAVNSFGNAVVGVSGTVTNNHLQYDRIRTQGTGMNGGNVLQLTINNYTSTSSYKPVGMYGLLNDSTGTTYNYFGAWMGNAALTSLVFSTSAGTFNAGTVELYGVK